MTVSTPRALGGYDEFAPFYDAFTSGSDYETWTEHVLHLATAHGLRGKRVLDVACGTGKSLLPFLTRGFDVTGCDLSAAMLSEARRKAPGVRLVQADVRALPELGAYDLITCFDDSLNHLPDEDDLASALRSMARNLSPTGLLLFDLNTLLAYRTTFAVDSVSTHEGVLFAWRGESGPDAEPGCRAAARIDAFAPRDDGLYERIATRHEQRHFPPACVTRSIAGAGLDCLGVHGVRHDGSHTDDLDETSQLKAMYVARLAKGGDPE
jgi:SAM-dependent methyltransferase